VYATTFWRCLSLQKFLKNVISCSLKETSGSTLDLPPLA
jgi:hypothetical protein